jgi:cyanophycin synthetase
MKILQIRAMRGPNYWSVKHKNLIVLKLDLQYPFDVAGLTNGLKRLNVVIPEGDNDADSLYLITGKIATALQKLAGMDIEEVNLNPKGQQQIGYSVFAYAIGAAGLYAGRAAVAFVNALTKGNIYDVDADIRALKRISAAESLGPSTKSIADEAARRDIPFTRLDDNSLIMFGFGCNQRFIRAAVASTTSAIAVELVQDKDATKNVLDKAKISVPKGLLAFDVKDLHDAIKMIGFPLVVKPLDGNHGRGITTNIQTQEDAEEAFLRAKNISRKVIIEKHIQGSDYRFLVVNYKLVAVAKRTPAHITGDGTSTVQQLIDEVNKDPRRGNGHTNVLTKITVDNVTLGMLAANGLTTASVIQAGEILYLKDTANLSSGGTADDITDTVHPENLKLAERIARLMNLDICGIDIMAEDVTVPITSDNGAVLEVNAGPGLRMHLAPSSGSANNVAAPIMDMLYPPGASARIPIVAVTGTNGKTTTTRLIAHIAKQAGHHPGYTTTDGICINGQLIEQGDCSGPASAAAVLRDPAVDFAVLECARGGILRAGLGFDKCSVSIVTNITEDHLGLDGIENLDDLTRVKSVVPLSTSEDGYAILNADDNYVYSIRDKLKCKVALFSVFNDNPRIQQHLNAGGLAAIVEDGFFTICKDKWRHKVIEVAEVPLTFNGLSGCMIKNVLPATLAAFISGIRMDHIRDALSNFIPSPQNTPGRMNMFDFGDFKLLMDYAHNEGGYQELKKYASHINASIKVGVIAATGDRREQDIINLGRLAAEIFDQIIIRHDRDGRGKTNTQLTDLLMQGIRQVKPNMQVTVISDEFEAIDFAINNAERDAWIFANLDNVHNTLAHVQKLHQMDRSHRNRISA